MKTLERAPTNDWRICCEVGDFYGTHDMLPTQRAERVHCWMGRAYRLADEVGKRQVAGRCAKGFWFRKYGSFDDDLALLQRLLAEGVEGPGYCLSKLGHACERGHGVKKDPQRAIEFYRQAAALDDRYSIKRLKELKAD